MPAAAAGANLEATLQAAAAVNPKPAAKTMAMMLRHSACLPMTLPHMAIGTQIIRLRFLLSSVFVVK